MDKDLQSIQEVRTLVKNAKEAQKKLRKYSQEEIDRLVKVIADACEQNSERLAKMAVEETGFGIWQDKVVKNNLGSRMVYDYMKDLKTIGIINRDTRNKVMEVAVPVGVIAALIPSTNPTSTTIFKALISLKGGNTVIFSPHPNARKCIKETVDIMVKAANSAGAPSDIIQCIDLVTSEAIDTLLKHKDVAVILATGGEAMVRAAYRSGNPAIGVGPGNGPAFIEKSADIKIAVKHILDSKTFDNGTICASEQSIVTEQCICDKVRAELLAQGAYFLTQEESDQLAKYIMRADNSMNPAIVGKSVKAVSDLAGLDIPKGIRVLISEQTTVGKYNPYSREKLCPILAFYVEKDWKAACDRCIEILENEGSGHTMTIHTADEAIVEAFALEKPVSRLLVNTPASLGGVGASANLVPSLTLGCGAVGGSSTSDNVGPLNLINIRRVAYGVKEIEELRGSAPASDNNLYSNNFSGGNPTNDISPEDLEKIVRTVISNIMG